ncbi:PadR family transcriptional regulator [Paraburkholderia sp. Ac-20340]|uniref:PadR family transcriptional regulator n=1 Tax=Paraburkholderia sp. Ac-20340 TaxID=2703888 RepID=UPI0019820B45|nr:PadR family transcriptional regulator [Paraburkholderia sp. Ac-20340]MBN3854856.1 PadR family transcriptional regulator [Paraburkholderia sp. Ac-20340]
MSLPHALLTALVERSCSGSELAARFDRSIGYFWHATHQQIYRELARMEEAGLIESLPEENTRGRKRAYRVLPAGRAQLKDWIAQEDEPAALRDEFMVRLRAEAAVGPTGLDREIRRRIGLHEAKLALYREIEERDFPAEPADRETALHHLVLQAGVRYEENWLALLKEALVALQKPSRASKPRRKKAVGAA